MLGVLLFLWLTDLPMEARLLVLLVSGLLTVRPSSPRPATGEPYHTEAGEAMREHGRQYVNIRTCYGDIGQYRGRSTVRGGEQRSRAGRTVTAGASAQIGPAVERADRRGPATATTIPVGPEFVGAIRAGRQRLMMRSLPEEGPGCPALEFLEISAL